MSKANAIQAIVKSKMSAKDISRFWSKVERRGPDDCWEWSGPTNGTGYGQIKIKGKHKLSHRVAFAIANNDPGDLFVLHKCDNPTCVNPNHLYAGTSSDNMQDVYRRGRRSMVGQRNAFAKLTEPQVVEIRKRIEDGESTRSIAADYPVAQSTIESISTGHSWAHLGPLVKGGRRGRDWRKTQPQIKRSER